jgi:hypothetical protein
MFYCIDYRNGSMGNTVLSHMLYACDQISVDLEQFFDQHSGNAHKIAQINRTNLTARHLLETPDPDANCVLEILCNDWDEILRIKMSYAKWYQAAPNLNNYGKFFDYTPCHQNEQLWQEFYQGFRDSSWPAECSFDQVHTLPELIQKEIFNNYQAPAAAIESESLLVEWLCTTYHNTFGHHRHQQFAHSHTVTLGDYLNGDVSELINVGHQLGWNWNVAKSDSFFKKVLDANQQYLTWLNKIKDCTLDVLNNHIVTDILEPWEQALIIAKFCHTHGVDPNSVKWHNIACSSNTNNVYLTKFTRTYHGKTI